MKKRSFMVASVSVVILLLACCLFTGQLVLNGCLWGDCAPERDFHVLDWEIPTELLPEGAINDHLVVPSEGIGEKESGGQTIYMDNGNGVTVYLIYRFKHTKDAGSHIDHYIRGMVNPETGEARDRISLPISTFLPRPRINGMLRVDTLMNKDARWRRVTKNIPFTLVRQ